jgi:hypothetical protein
VKGKYMNYKKLLLSLFKNGYLTITEVNSHKIPHIYLTKLIQDNLIKRVSRGLYILQENLPDDFVILQSKSKNAIFSNMTALYLYGFSNRIPIKYDITINNGYNGSLQHLNNVNLYYTSKDMLLLGVKNYKLSSNNIIRVYDLERTICDIIKNKKRIDRELYNKAIKSYFYSNEKDIIKLYDYAKKMHIYDKVRDTFEVLS